jgi:hypothetical protein
VCTLACKTSNSAPLRPRGQSVSMSRVLRSCLPWAHVRCLYVPVDDSFRMCGIKGHRQFSCPDRALPRFPAACQRSCAGASAPQQFHGDEGSSIGLVNLMDRANVRVVQEDVALAPPRCKRLGACPLLASLLGRNFRATCRPTFRSSATYTTLADAFRLCAFERSEIGNDNNGAASRQTKESSV